MYDLLAERSEEPVRRAGLKMLHAEAGDRVLEIGFGTGFNFFLTADLALKYKTALTYYAVEKNLPDYKDYIKLNHTTHFSMNSAWLNFLSWRSHSSMLKNGVYKIVHRNINLYLILSDAIDMKLPENLFDAVYQDAFSPNVNPELWTISFFKKIILAMKPGAKLSTYSAKGDVKRALQEAGYFVNKLPGPIGKREMLVASRSL